MYKPEIDEVLTRQLGRVAAPEELWGRIENPQVLAGVPTRHARVHALLLAAILIAVVVFQTRRGTEQNIAPRVTKATLNASCHLCHAGG